jgi:hydrogenase expression/formation protein HypC
MCLALPGQVVSVRFEHGLRIADVEFGGVRRPICLDCTPDAQVGSFVIVHAGFAIAILDEHAAAETLALVTETAPGSPSTDGHGDRSS